MLRMSNLPEEIKSNLMAYYSKKEKPDVFPSKFEVNGEYYYFFTFAPAAEQVIMKANGEVPWHDEISNVALIATSYNHSIEVTAHIGFKWANPERMKIFISLRDLLEEIEQHFKEMPIEVRESLHVYKRLAKELIEKQRIIENSVEDAKKLWDRTNESELVRENDQKVMRAYVVETVQAGYRQNEAQLETDSDRNTVEEFVKKNKSLFDFKSMKLWSALKKQQNVMMKKTKKNLKEMEELSEIKEGDKPLEQHENVPDILNHLRNKRR
ncbi:hypothetical protein MHI57_18475 [Cytobacillus sp. FSL K6-0129]|uniref:hypothetical protein n=1 Tax=Cytobacillus sp. FSL K6-0129 TaxID=2921421 RepID=UPI0030F6DD56